MVSCIDIFHGGVAAVANTPLILVLKPPKASAIVVETAPE